MQLLLQGESFKPTKHGHPQGTWAGGTWSWGTEAQEQSWQAQPAVKLQLHTQLQCFQAAANRHPQAEHRPFPQLSGA